MPEGLRHLAAISQRWSKCGSVPASHWYGEDYLSSHPLLYQSYTAMMRGKKRNDQAHILKGIPEPLKLAPPALPRGCLVG